MIINYNGYEYTYDGEWFIIGDQSESQTQLWNKFTNICSNSSITVNETSYTVKIKFNPDSQAKYIDMNSVSPLGISGINIKAEIDGQDWEIRNTFFNISDDTPCITFSNTSSSSLSKLNWLNLYIKSNSSISPFMYCSSGQRLLRRLRLRGDIMDNYEILDYFKLRKRAAIQAYLSTIGKDLNYRYRTMDNEYVSLQLYYGTSQNVIVPEEMEGYPVREIAATCFNYKNLLSVTIPSGVTKIG